MSLCRRRSLLFALAVLSACSSHKGPKNPDGGPAVPTPLAEPTSDGVLISAPLVQIEENGPFVVKTSVGALDLQKTCVIGAEAIEPAKGKQKKSDGGGKVVVLDERLVVVRPSPEQAAELIRRGEAVPNYLLHSGTDDPRFGDQWALHNTGGRSWDNDPGTTRDEASRPADIDINAPEAWVAWAAGQKPKDVLVAVIDSGIAYDQGKCEANKTTGERPCMHRDLRDNVWVNPGECPTGPTCFNGLDDDNNGYVDDVHGINAITAAAASKLNPGKKPPAGHPVDDNGHGTWVSGVIDAVSENRIDVAGIGRKTQLIVCKFLNQYGEGDTCDAIRCLDYVHRVRQNPKTKDLVVAASNNSWGGGAYSPALQKAIETQRADGVLFVTGAGNDAQDNDLTPFYPANYDAPNLISVAATDWWDEYWPASNWGRRVHVAAPGAAIRTLRPIVQKPCCDTPGCYHPGCVGGLSYTEKSGTSMSAAQVSGLAALVSSKQADPQKDWAKVRNLILAGGTMLPAPAAPTAPHVLTGRRIRAADVGGIGSLTCSGRQVQKILPPTPLTPASPGVDYRVEVLSVDCANPLSLSNPKVGVAKIVGGVPVPDKEVSALDNGAGEDLSAGDGVFSAAWKQTAGAGRYRFTLLQTGDFVEQDIP